MIAEVAQAVVATPAIADSASTIQFYLVVIQAMWAVLLLILGVVIASLARTLRDFQTKYLELYKLILTEYATKTDLSKRVHGFRDDLGVHSTWIHLLAHVLKIDLPGSNNRRHNDGSEG